MVWTLLRKKLNMQPNHSKEEVLHGFSLLPEKTQQKIKARARQTLKPFYGDFPSFQDINDQIVERFWEVGADWDLLN